ncbi:Myo-inositol transporter-like protein [Emericellopsis cladophorae]|uniref:Myo-inositol transporter-like protein n=1 Tax=Emericellopsis cladophorae TaxID=2686198 RepID=A0A9P9Y1D9_9HYPO|nr:Myo-inositol transporter-like protein [Emericellopsis cladophorae]KAI6781531.1 Myo-inositol transporter-like protein [Emericellopsis cladophorae]
MDRPEAPLIPEDQRDHELQSDGDDAETDAGSIASKANTNPGVFVLVLTFAAGISGLLFGYDTGVISSTLVSIGTSLSNRELTSMDKSIITSSTSLFALILSPLSSVLADKFGRKRVILFADVLFVAGALVQAYSDTVTGMVAGRCVVGAAVGAASFVVPLYIAEVAPASHRGRLVTMNVLFITLGQAVAYIVGWIFSTFGSPTSGWRWTVGLGALPAVFQAGLVFFMPETPRWLVKVGRSTAAKSVIQRVNGGAAASTRNADAVIREIEVEAREEQEARRFREHERAGPWRWLGAWQELLSEGQNRRALAIACLLQGLQQLCGFNSLMYFSATIFTLVGFKNPTLTSLTVAVTNFIFTMVALTLIDRIGRRRILLYSLPFMILGLLLSALGFSFISLGDTAEASAQDADGSGAGSAATLILVSIMLYVASFALGLGNVPWMQSELFPLAVRSLGSGVSTATNWGCNFIIGLTFLPLMDLLSPSWTFVLYAAICVVGYILVWGIYPETAGLNLEEATALLEHGWGVSLGRDRP